MGKGIIVMTSGVWDLFHIGHINILKKSKALGDKLVVGVVSDDGVEAYKGRKPIFNEKQRLEIIRSLKFVDYASIQPTTDPTPLVCRYRPHIFTHGDDWKELIEGQETLIARAIKFKLLPYTKNISTTKILERVKNEF